MNAVKGSGSVLQFLGHALSAVYVQVMAVMIFPGPEQDTTSSISGGPLGTHMT